MRHHRHRGEWILYGVGLAVGFLVFKIFVILVALATGVVWGTTKNWTAFWQRTTRTIFVITLILIVALLATIIFGE